MDAKLAVLQAAAWLVANPTKKKSNYERFLTGWLKREQDRGGNRNVRNDGRATEAGGAAQDGSETDWHEYKREVEAEQAAERAAKAGS